MDGGAVSWFLSITKTASTSSPGVARAGQGALALSFLHGRASNFVLSPVGGEGAALPHPQPGHTHSPLSLRPEVYAVQRGQACPLTKVVDLLGLPVGGCPEPDLGSEALHVSFR